MARRSVLLIVLSLLFQGVAFSEIKEIGTPLIRNFSKHEYMAGTQNWAISQDHKGFMYFANNEGLLVFDGMQWQLYEMPNSSMVRSIFIDDRGIVYIGAYNDIGKMVSSPNGNLVFHSLKSYIPQEYQNFDDVWNIMPYRDKVVFQSYYAAYAYGEGSSVSIIKAPSRFQCSYSVSGRLLFNDVENGLLEFDGEKLISLEGCEELIGQDIWSVMPYKTANSLLICTLGRGLYIYDGKGLREWNIPVNEFLKKNQIFSAAPLQDRYFALGTILDGVIIIDDNGKMVQHINHKKGLQNNTILELFSDRVGNLWLGLDNGIDYVTVNSPITFLQSPDGFGAGYAAIIHNGKLYLGTNQGLYVTDWEDDKPGTTFTMVPGTYGQVWYLGVHNGLLICGHNNGTYLVDGKTAHLINNIPGGWKYHSLIHHPGYMIGGTYSGILLFRWDNGTWNFIRRIAGFNESFRVFEEDENGDLWMSHGFKGIYRVTLSENLDSVSASRFYNVKDGLPSNFNLNVYKIKSKLIYASESGIFEYNSQKDQFEFSVYFNQILSPLSSFSYLREDEKGNIWYVSDNKVGVFRIQEDFSFQHVTSPFTLLAGRFNKGFESIYTWSDEHLFFAIEDGYAHYSPHAYYKIFPEFSTYITRAVAMNPDSIFYYGRSILRDAGKATGYSFPFKKNGFRFTYSSPVYDNPGNIEYSYKLSGLDENWSAWSKAYSKEFMHLPEGRFVFMVKARNQLGIESLTDSLEITVLSPWYKSLIAWVAYVVLFISSALMLIWTISKRIEISGRNERLKHLRAYRAKEQEYIRQALEAEKEIISMKNEGLRIEMIQRDKELANQAMSLVRKNEFLIKIKEELQSLKESAQEENVSEKIVSIISRIKREVDHNKQREVFERAFDEVHEEFLNKLKTMYHSLTPTELRLCAYLKMNISTKEIAPLLNISMRGVEICRYRVRKKLGIDRKTNLVSLLINL
ncbi:MAG TPA: triple tyrosine motif-containing protein [Bacteroidales bacterium]|nr:triple tyrosine motif-containing protein [Bacteroidales bacterium]